MTLERHGWKMVRFSAAGDAPAYVDLAEVAAVVDAPHPEGKGQLDVARGAMICLKSGLRVHVCETADTVFDEVHRYNTEAEPVPKPIKLSAMAPADGDTSAVPLPE